MPKLNAADCAFGPYSSYGAIRRADRPAVRHELDDEHPVPLAAERAPREGFPVRRVARGMSKSLNPLRWSSHSSSMSASASVTSRSLHTRRSGRRAGHGTSEYRRCVTPGARRRGRVSVRSAPPAPRPAARGSTPRCGCQSPLVPRSPVPAWFGLDPCLGVTPTPSSGSQRPHETASASQCCLWATRLGAGASERQARHRCARLAAPRSAPRPAAAASGRRHRQPPPRSAPPPPPAGATARWRHRPSAPRPGAEAPRRRHRPSAPTPPPVGATMWL